MTVAKKTKPQKTEAEKDSAPSFVKWQLIDCKKLDAPCDVIMAVLDDSRTYTLAEAKETIKEFLNRKV